MSNQATTSSSSSSSSSKQGIDIREALEILALRNNPDDHSHDHHHPHSSSSDCHEAPTKDAVHWGQRIQLGGSEDDANNNNDNHHAGSQLHEETKMANHIIEQQKERIERERAERRAMIEEKLASLSVLELLECVMNSQEERVKTYRNYDKGLDDVLKSGNVSNYPSVCAETTASFSVLSETILAVRRVLDAPPHRRRDLTRLVTRLQAGEKEKLNLTAALHLEQIRANSQKQMDEQQEKMGGEGPAVDTRIALLLEESVETLKEKIAATVEEINETLEELRFALMEEREK